MWGVEKRASHFISLKICGRKNRSPGAVFMCIKRVAFLQSQAQYHVWKSTIPSAWPFRQARL